jgi:hypothetical protein
MLKEYFIIQLPYALEHVHRYLDSDLLLRQTNRIAICTWTRSEILEMQLASEHGQKRDQRLAGSHAQMSTIGNSFQVKEMLTSAMSVLRRCT